MSLRPLKISEIHKHIGVPIWHRTIEADRESDLSIESPPKLKLGCRHVLEDPTQYKLYWGFYRYQHFTVRYSVNAIKSRDGSLKLCLQRDGVVSDRTMLGWNDLTSAAREAAAQILYDHAAVCLTIKNHLEIIQQSFALKSEREEARRVYMDEVSKALDEVELLLLCNDDTPTLANGESFVDYFLRCDEGWCYYCGESIGMMVSSSNQINSALTAACVHFDAKICKIYGDAMDVDRRPHRDLMDLSRRWTLYVSGRVRGMLQSSKVVDYKTKFALSQRDLQSTQESARALEAKLGMQQTTISALRESKLEMLKNMKDAQAERDALLKQLEAKDQQLKDYMLEIEANGNRVVMLDD